MDFSIVIPAYNEACKIAADIAAADLFLTEHKLTGEMIVVDDGSQDDTAEVARKTPIAGVNRLFVASYQPQRGKGYAVRTGIAMTTGDVVLFADSGHCVPYSYAKAGLDLIETGKCDIAHGSRKLPQSNIVRPRIWYREIVSWLFHYAMIGLVRVPPHLTDTQCGFKVYRGSVARTIYAPCRTDGFMFDIEVILRARQRGNEIMEFPIEWRADHDSRLSLIKNLKPIIWELFSIRKMFAG